MRMFGHPVVDQIMPMPYVGALRMFDASIVEGNHYRLRSRSLAAVSKDAAEALTDAAARLTSPYSSLIVNHFHGAAARVDPATTAFAQRKPHHPVEIIAAWAPGDSPERHYAWGDAVADALDPLALPGRLPQPARPGRRPPRPRVLRPQLRPPARAQAPLRPRPRLLSHPGPARIPARRRGLSRLHSQTARRRYQNRLRPQITPGFATRTDSARETARYRYQGKLRSQQPDSSLPDRTPPATQPRRSARHHARAGTTAHSSQGSMPELLGGSAITGGGGRRRRTGRIR